MDDNDYHDEWYEPPKPKSEFEEWREDDNLRRYREWQMNY